MWFYFSKDNYYLQNSKHLCHFDAFWRLKMTCMDVSMVAGVGRRPLAQVLSNSLSGHPPTTGTTRCHVVNLSSESVT